MTSYEPRTLLLVDDNESLAAALAYNLRRAGYVVLTAADGVEALETAQAHRPDVIVSDIEMPEMDGIQFCRSLRCQPRFAQTPFLFLTAHGGTEEKVTGLRCGADDYIVKPFELEELVARIDLLCQKREREAAQPQLTGKIEEISIPEVLQFLSLAGKEGLLRITRGRASGWVSVRAGTVADAHYEGAAGQEALVALVTLTDGLFRFEPGEVGEGSIGESAMFAVMEATRIADERRKGGDPPASDPDTLLAVAPGLDGENLDMEALCRELEVGMLFSDEPSDPADDSAAATPEEPPRDLMGEPSGPPAGDAASAVVSTAGAAAASPARTEPGAALSAPCEPTPSEAPSKARTVAARATKVLFAFTDEASAVRVLAEVAKAFRSERPKGFSRASVDFQRIAFDDWVIHLFSSRAEKKHSFLWEPILATADAALFLVASPSDAEHLAHFKKSLPRTRPIPFAVVTDGPAGSDSEARGIQSSRDVLAVFSELLERP